MEMKNSYIYSSKNEIVDQMGMISIRGNVIPHEWFQTIKRQSGKPYMLAIVLLADIVYWYRPVEARDEATGQLIGWRKKFKEDLLQRSYDQFAQMYGESKRAITDAIVHLERLGIIKRVFRTIEIPGGLKANNVLYIYLDTENLKKFTFPIREQEPDNASAEEKMEYVNHKVDEEIQVGNKKKHCREMAEISHLDTPIPEFRDRGISENVPPVPEFRDRVSRNFVIGLPEFRETNTENTTENTYIDYPSINQSIVKQKEPDGVGDMGVLTPVQERRAYQEIISENIALTDLKKSYPYEQDMIEEILELILDNVCSTKERLKIAQEEIPQQMVKNRFLKLRYRHIEYVLLCLKNNKTQIKNIRAYLLSCLYNALATTDAYYTAQANYDFFQRE